MSKLGDKNREGFKAMLQMRQQGAKDFAPLSQDFVITAPRPKVGGWYFVAPCNQCGRPSPIIEDEVPGGDTNIFRGTGAFVYSCYHCRKTVTAPAETVFSMQWQRAE